MITFLLINSVSSQSYQITDLEEKQNLLKEVFMDSTRIPLPSAPLKKLQREKLTNTGP
jgi:hypothetical protein